jgi:hypothetical protein
MIFITRPTFATLGFITGTLLYSYSRTHSIAAEQGKKEGSGAEDLTLLGPSIRYWLGANS